MENLTSGFGVAHGKRHNQTKEKAIPVAQHPSQWFGPRIGGVALTYYNLIFSSSNFLNSSQQWLVFMFQVDINKSHTAAGGFFDAGTYGSASSLVVRVGDIISGYPCSPHGLYCLLLLLQGIVRGGSLYEYKLDLQRRGSEISSQNQCVAHNMGGILIGGYN